jgi:cytochrome P450
MYKSVSIFGPNIVASEFDEWKRHRRIAAPSFSEKNNRLVYEETTRIVTELFQLWSENGNGRVVEVENAVHLTSNLALMVISSAGEYLTF